MGKTQQCVRVHTHQAVGPHLHCVFTPTPIKAKLPFQPARPSFLSNNVKVCLQMPRSYLPPQAHVIFEERRHGIRVAEPFNFASTPSQYLQASQVGNQDMGHSDTEPFPFSTLCIFYGRFKNLAVFGIGILCLGPGCLHKPRARVAQSSQMKPKKCQKKQVRDRMPCTCVWSISEFCLHWISLSIYLSCVCISFEDTFLLSTQCLGCLE